MAKSVHLSIRIDPELHEALRKLAEDDRRPLSTYIALALKDHAEAQQPKKGKASGPRS